jgi:Protein of unknown function (DUF1566)
MKMQRFLVIVAAVLLVLCASLVVGSGDALSQGPTDLLGVTRNWFTALPADQRFVVLPSFRNLAARDNITGLVWEKVPSQAFGQWENARAVCINKAVGGQKGWRLPSIAELASLIDPSVSPTFPTLPPGHPFENFDPITPFYWSASTSMDPQVAPGGWVVNFLNGNVRVISKRSNSLAWCVRGPMQESAY